jgi:hypothetical protein
LVGFVKSGALPERFSATLHYSRNSLHDRWTLQLALCFHKTPAAVRPKVDNLLRFA